MTSKIVQRAQPCPKCPSSDAYFTYDDGHGYCFSCQYYFNPAKGGEDEGNSFEYLPWRGIEKECFRKYAVLTKIDREGRPISVGFPYPNKSTKIRTMDEKVFYWVGDSEAGLFGLDRFQAGGHQSVIITEGELDAISLHQVTGVPAVSVRSSSSAVADVTSARSWLAAYERIYLALDNDAVGREATRNIARLFDFNKLYHIKFTNRKDANEFLQHGEGHQLRNLFYNSRKYLPEEVINSSEEFRRILSEPRKAGVSYPFPTLTKMTYGIRTGETVVIKAPEKVGKTALMHSILHHLLKETDDNVGAIFLEEPKARLLQSIAGLELRRPVHLADCDCSSDQIYSALEKVLGRDERLHIYSHFGTDDPTVLLDTIRFLVTTRNCRYILFDHITMAVTGLANERDERRALDFLATRLEMMVKELDFALIMVSHVNDEGQTRGSRYITKVSDITIDASRNTMSVDEKTRRTIKLAVPFNRYCFMTGPAGDIVFDPDTYTLAEEVANDTNVSINNERRVA